MLLSRLLILTALAGATMAGVTSCADDDKGIVPPMRVELRLPLTIDFAATSVQGNKNLTFNGLDFTGSAIVSSDFVNGVLQCPASTNATMRGATGKVQLANPDFNCLIADVSKMPAMQKITVKMLDNGRAATQLSLCDGTQVIATSTTYTGTTPEVTYTLAVDGKKASKFYIYSTEAEVKSIVFE
ncbi:hypothetical protein [Hymenobacter lucidus]|uniref:Lipocalin-like domain-containing protein n=1 Tax=Hymenobacter lucidus TaxID=2880930 RepID=A0ABS8AU82_9BACT|nr:hypothetical protein [Hymenobacter lucidus]MCB2409780.1 hypothetical protein [Hymenobacter lucidus]